MHSSGHLQPTAYITIMYYSPSHYIIYSKHANLIYYNNYYTCPYYVCILIWSCLLLQVSSNQSQQRLTSELMFVRRLETSGQLCVPTWECPFLRSRQHEVTTLIRRRMPALRLSCSGGMGTRVWSSAG